MHGENPSSADNQQERSKEFWRGYVTGLVDGEGTFHIAFQIRDDLPSGISIIPEFHISQNFQSKFALEIAQKFLECGYIKPNHQNSKDFTYVLVVRDRIDLITKIIPFFQHNQLVTDKRNDFNIFATVVQLMYGGHHLKRAGINQIIDLAYSMNKQGSRRIRSKQQLLSLLKSSETTRKNRN